MQSKGDDLPARETASSTPKPVSETHVTQEPQNANDRAALVDLVKLIGDSVNVAGEHLISRMHDLGFSNDSETVTASNEFLSSIMPAIIFKSNVLYDYVHKCIFTLTRQRQQTRNALLAQQQKQEDQIAHEVRRLITVKKSIGVLNAMRAQTDLQLAHLKQLCDAVPSSLYESVDETKKIVQEVEADAEKNMSMLSALNIAIPPQSNTRSAPDAPSTNTTGSVAKSATLASSSRVSPPQMTLDPTQIFAEMRHPDESNDNTSKLCTRLIR